MIDTSVQKVRIWHENSLDEWMNSLCTISLLTFELIEFCYTVWNGRLPEKVCDYQAGSHKLVGWLWWFTLKVVEQGYE